MSVIYRDTYLKSQANAFVRSPAGSKVRNSPSSSLISSYFIRGLKSYWGFPGYNSSTSITVPAFTTNTVTPSFLFNNSPVVYFGGTDDIGSAPYYGPSTNTINGEDIVGTTTTDYWNGAYPYFTSITKTQTTANGTVLDYLNNPHSVTATLSGYRDVGYSIALQLANSGSWTDPLLVGGNAAEYQTCDELIPGQWYTIPVPGYTPYFSGTGTGKANGFMMDNPGNQSFLNNLIGGFACSGWYLLGIGYTGLPAGNFYVQRGAFQNVGSSPLYYFFGEVYAKWTYNGVISFIPTVHYVGPGGILNPDGTIIEVPQPNDSGPTDMSFQTGYFQRMVVPVINQSMEQWAASLGATII